MGGLQHLGTPARGDNGRGGGTGHDGIGGGATVGRRAIDGDRVTVTRGVALQKEAPAGTGEGGWVDGRPGGGGNNAEGGDRARRRAPTAEKAG